MLSIFIPNYLTNTYKINKNQTYYLIIGLAFIFALCPLLYNLLYIQSFNITDATDDTITSFHVGVVYIWTAILFTVKFVRTDFSKIMFLYGTIANLLAQVFWHTQGLSFLIGEAGQYGSYLLWIISFIIAVFIYYKTNWLRKI